jgi:threonylcarbamoyladenosine tRNA methylthiotransferase MtaB
MPQVSGPVIRDRASRLRAAGEAAARRHLQAQVGRTHRILMEGPRLGRTEQFAEVAFGADRPAGAILEAAIRGVEGGRLAA